MKVSWTVPGEPAGKGRPRFARTGAGVRTYTPEKTAQYENLIRLEYGRQVGGMAFGRDVPLRMTVTAWLSIPKSAGVRKRELMEKGVIRPLKRPDSSNILKAVEDAGNGVVYPDDSQIVDTVVRRFYSGCPRLTVTVEEVQA